MLIQKSGQKIAKSQLCALYSLESQMQQEVFGIIYRKKKCGQCSRTGLHFWRVRQTSDRIIFKMWFKIGFTLFKNPSVFQECESHYVKSAAFPTLNNSEVISFFSDGTWQVLMKYHLPIAKAYNRRCFKDFWPEFWSEKNPLLKKTDGCSILIKIIAD